MKDLIKEIEFETVNGEIDRRLAGRIIVALLETGKEVMPDVSNDAPNEPDAAPASTDDAGGGATREEVAEALWIANMSGFVPQMRSRFADIEGYNRNHWLKLADVAIKTIKGEKK